MASTIETRYSVLFDLTTDQFHVADNLTGDVSEESFATEAEAQTLADEWEAGCEADIDAGEYGFPYAGVDA